jgi:hypothetical protein
MILSTALAATAGGTPCACGRAYAMLYAVRSGAAAGSQLGLPQTVKELCVHRVLLVLCLLLGGWAVTLPARAPAHASVEPQDAPWRTGTPTGAVWAVPIRLVAPAEPWDQVVQDLHTRLRPRVAGRALRVGLYGHGAFVTPAEVLTTLPFVAALGEAAAMDVMVVPHWDFPTRLPWQAFPRHLLQALLLQQIQPPEQTVVALLRRTARQFAGEHRAATKAAVGRLAAGLSAFHHHQMTPSLAAFSQSALVLVRLGEMLEPDPRSEGETHPAVPEAVRQGVALTNVVTFGYPLPNGHVTAALRRRIRGTFVNVVPAHCGPQWLGNFPLRGPVKNLPVAWAPAHAAWPHLSPQGPEVAVLGALLGGESPARPSRHAAQVGPHPTRDPVGSLWWETLCAVLQGVDPAGLFSGVD